VSVEDHPDLREKLLGAKRTAHTLPQVIRRRAVHRGGADPELASLDRSGVNDEGSSK
jgi:hypothetical protein